MRVFILVLRRDLKIAFRRWTELATPLMFFVIVASLLPLALSADESRLTETGPGFLWVAALLSSLLALDGLFYSDMQDGSMEQFALSPEPLEVLVLAKILAHWFVSGVPLIIMAPFLALSFYTPVDVLPTLLWALLLATPTLSVLAAIGAALTVSLRGGGAIMGLLVLPLTAPVLIFGARATEFASTGEAVQGPLYLLGSMAVFALTLGPIACAAALRVSME
jgi:heme exporter protein B